MAGLEPKRLAPLFIATAVLHGAALFTRFSDVAAGLPDWLPWTILFAQFPLLAVAGYFEARLDYGENVADLPLWMRIKSVPVKVSFTLAFTYLAVVVLQLWDVSIGPIDPTPPPEWPLQRRLMWFAIMSGGMFFPNYLAATSLLVPNLRRLAGLTLSFPRVAGLAAMTAAGIALGAGAVFGLRAAAPAAAIGDVQQTIGASLGLTLAVTLGLIFIPMAVGWILDRDAE